MESNFGMSELSENSFPFPEETESVIHSEASYEASSPVVIVNQNSLAIDSFSKNGIQKLLHIVVKNQPFTIQAALTAFSPTMNFHKFPLEARLLYDCENLKEVDFVKHKPLEFKTQVNEKGDNATVELRLKVLTSQLEDMFFRIRLVMVEPFTKRPLEGFTVVSEAIKVVSKPEQVKKVHKKQNTITSPHPSTKKRDLNDTLHDSLVRIETNLNNFGHLFNSLIQLSESQQSTSQNLVNSLLTQLQAYQEMGKFPDPSSNKRSNDIAQQGSLESSLNRLLTAFESLPASQRPTRVRRAARAQANETQAALSVLRNAASNPAFYVSQARGGQPAAKKRPMAMQYENSVENSDGGGVHGPNLMFAGPANYLEGF